jgi:membrane fusion protein (multidrug efflux system)
MMQNIDRGGRGVRVVPLVLLALAACGDAEAGNGTEAGEAEPSFVRVINVQIEEVQPSRFVEEILLTGVVEANRDVTVSAEEGGTVKEILVDKGRWVAAGQPLLRIDDAVLRAQVDQARAAAELARETWDRRKRLWEEERVGAELAYLEARFAAEQSAANLRSLEERLARTVIQAPFEGLLEDRMVEVGSLLSPGTAVFRIMDVHPVKVVAGVPERYAPDVQVGASARVTFDVLPEAGVDGRIRFVGAAVDPRNRTFPVELRLPNRDGRIKPEMLANVSLERRAFDDAVVVPQDVLVRTAEGYIVFVADGEGEALVARERLVELGPSAANRVVVTAGLEAGDRLIVVGQKSVANGDRIRVVGEGA